MTADPIRPGGTRPETGARGGPRRALSLLASTSVLALGLVAAPVALDLDPGQVVLTAAQADGSCCFTGDTPVLMADGRDKPIRDVRVGDLVMGRAGRANRVVGVERPRLGKRVLYSINGGPHFVTAEHPFATAAGWKAIDPAAGAGEAPELELASLVPGDCLLCRRTGNGPGATGNLALAEPALEAIVIVVLDARPGHPETPLYNLVLDGDHAYFAHGYLVHNKDGGGDGDGGEGDDGGEAGEAGDDGDDGGEAGDDGDDGGEAGEDSDLDEAGEAGEVGSAGPGAVSPSAFGGLEQVGPDLSPEEEADAIAKGWR